LKKFSIIILIIVFFLGNSTFAESRFGQLTEIKDERMRGKSNQWVRPHPGPFVWSFIEQKQDNFIWEDTDEYIKYAQKYNQKILATIWPYAKWDQKTCNKNKKSKSPFGKKFPKRLNKPCSMENYLNFLSKLVDRYDGDGKNDMPELINPITYWEIMNEPEFKMFFNGSKEDFVEIFNASSKLIKEKQKNSVIVMAGAAGMFPENKKFWKFVLPKIQDHFDIANIHHITPPDGKCDKDMWVGEFAQLLNSLKIKKPIWVTEAMVGKCKVLSIYINAFVNGAELIIDVGVSAPGMKMSKKKRQELNKFIDDYDGFESIKLISKKEAEFQYIDGSTKTLKFK